jgi:hypothetical protein
MIPQMLQENNVYIQIIALNCLIGLRPNEILQVKLQTTDKMFYNKIPQLVVSNLSKQKFIDE